MKIIDNFLNNITMYRLLLYYLIALLVLAVVFSFLGLLPFSPFALIFTTILFLLGCVVTNAIFAYVYKAHTNVESAYITALILALIISPYKHPYDLSLFFWACVWSMASKYIFAVNKKHIFNPAAAGVAITAIFLNQSASWWVATAPMLLPVLLGGFLIVRKIKRWDLVLSFFTTALVVILGFGFFKGTPLLTLLRQTFVDSPILFFAFVMLTEPLTTPPTSDLRIDYGVLTGFLFAPQIRLGSFYTTPEIALILGNIFSYLVSPKEKMILALKQKIQIAPDVYDFIFNKEQRFNFTPGQYLEWTLKHKRVDTRGNRRYFTIASSPTEDSLRIGVKFAQRGSSFKRQMLNMGQGYEIVGSHLAGDFTLPKNKNQRLVFIAGGIGVTPFRSMLKYLIDNKEDRPVTLFFVNRKKEDIVYQDVIEEAKNKLGIKVVYVLTDAENAPSSWSGKVGRINEGMIKEEVEDFKDALFYLSGPHSLVTTIHTTLKKMGIAEKKIKTDLFPGFA